MAYDPEKDILLWERAIEGDKKTERVCSIRQYDISPPKLGLAKRYFTKDGEGKFKKLGRLSKAEAEKLADFLPNVIEKLLEIDSMKYEELQQFLKKSSSE